MSYLSDYWRWRLPRFTSFCSKDLPALRRYNSVTYGLYHAPKVVVQQTPKVPRSSFTCRLPWFRKERIQIPRPLSMSSLEDLKSSYVPTRKYVNRNVSSYNRQPSYLADGYMWRREIPLCTIEDLLEIIREPSGYYALPTDPWNEVYPGVYLSDAPTALCTAMLKRMGITHVLNAAQGKEKNCGQVNTSSTFYSHSGIKFLGVPAFDNIVFKIHPYFEEAASFIDDALKSGGQVLVHCRMGISRSATLVCAFLMLKRGLTVQEAVKAVRKNRAIIPNDGFLQQLCDLNEKLVKRKKFLSD